MKLGFIVESRYLRQYMPGAVIDALAARDIAIDLLNPNHGYLDPVAGMFHDAAGRRFALRGYDAIISRNRNALGLSMLAFAETAGIPTMNTHAAVQRVRNKADMAIRLSLAGIRSAPTYLADHAAALTVPAHNTFPLILKATYGDNSQGLRLVRSPEELADLHWGNELALAQSYLPNSGFDLKLYVCGEHVFAVRKPSPFNGDGSAAPQRVEPNPQTVELALRCGELFGLDLYGVDTIETPDGPVVIEVNDFPNYSGIPGIGELLADHILGQVGARRH